MVNKLALSLLILLFSTLVFAKDNVILLGTQGPETGSIATSGLQILSGIKLAVAEINANGGINGKQIKLINMDSRGDKVESLNAAKKLINAKVCTILGDLSSGSVFTIRDTVNRSKTPLISSGATADGVTTGRPFIFRNTLLDVDGVPETINFIVKNKGYKKYAIITSMNNDYSVANTEYFKKAVKNAGGVVVAEQSIFDGDNDVSAQITSLKNKDFDALIYTGYYQEAILLLLELRKQKMGQVIIGGDGILFPDLWLVAKDAAIGSILFSGFSPETADPKVIEFNKKAKEANIQSAAYSAQGYDAVYLFAEAYKKAEINSCASAADRDKIREQLSQIKNFKGISGEMSFDKEGNAIKKAFIQEIVKDNGTYYPKLLNNQ